MAGTQFLYAPNRIIDANGIASGGSVFFYATETSTLAAIYADAALTTPLANPVVVGADGLVPTVYMDPETVYRVRTVSDDGTVNSDIDPYRFGITEAELTSLEADKAAAAASATAAATSAAAALVSQEAAETAETNAETAEAAAEAAQSAAEGFRDEAEGFRDQTATNAGIYDDVTAAIAGTAAGDYFAIPSASSEGYVDLYKNVDDTAPNVLLIDTLPNKTALDNVINLIQPPTEPAAAEDNLFVVAEVVISGDTYAPFAFNRATGKAVVSPPDLQTARAWDNAIRPFFGRDVATSPILYLPYNGQSWTVGGGQSVEKVTSQNPAVVTARPWDTFSLMFNGGMRNGNSTAVASAAIADFVPAVERFDALSGSYQGETPCSATMAQFSMLQRQDRVPLNFLLSKSHGRGNTAISGLNKGGSTNAYANGLAELQAAISIAAKYGRSIYCPFILWQQGEADVGVTSKADYKTAMVQLIADYRADWGPLLSAQYSGHPTLRMLIGQLASATNGTGSEIMIAHEELAREYPNDFILVGPWYHLELGTDTSHPTAQSYALMGEYFGRAAFETLHATSWLPTRLDHTYGTNGVSRSGSTITVKVSPRMGELVLDTTSLPAFNNGTGGSGGVDTYGFSYTGANITAVSLSATNTITITLDAAAAGTLRYAYDGVNLGSGFERPGAWGNFRDGGGTLGSSVHLMSRTNPDKLMWNWLTTFERAVA